MCVHTDVLNLACIIYCRTKFSMQPYSWMVFEFLSTSRSGGTCKMVHVLGSTTQFRSDKRYKNKQKNNSQSLNSTLIVEIVIKFCTDV